MDRKLRVVKKLCVAQHLKFHDLETCILYFIGWVFPVIF